MRWFFAFLMLALSAAAHAQVQPVETQEQALAEDAEQYAAQFGVTPGEALRRLKAQQASAEATEGIAREFEAGN